MPTPRTLPAAGVATLLGDLPATRPVYRAVAGAIRLAVADGRISPGTRMPSERELTARLGVSRTTVAGAYAMLRDLGYLQSRRGSGSVATLPEPTRRLGSGSLYPAEPREDVIDLTCAAVRAPAGVAEAYEAAVARLPSYLAAAGYLTHGLPELREALADRYAARGLPTTPDQVVVTSGAIAGVATVAAALHRPGGRVLVETPGYPNTLGVFGRAGARVTTMPVGPAGWSAAAVESAVAAAAAPLAVVVPDFQNPTGALMPDDVRAVLARALRRAGTVPVVDETIVDVVLDTPLPLPRPFAAHHAGTITVGSMAKSHWGGLRTGWIRLPRRLIQPIVEARMTTDPGAAVLEQLVTAELLRSDEGMPTGRRLELLHSRDALVTALHTRLPGIRFTVPGGGMSLWCELPEGTDATEVAVAAEVQGLLVAAGPRFAPVGGLGRWLRIPYVQPPEVMTEAVDRLASAMERTDAGARASRRRPERRRRRP
ncbi:MAG: PLP-dependent aminotransferase family protein, partial [Dermatophilaceae bacterium]